MDWMKLSFFLLSLSPWKRRRPDLISLFIARRRRRPAKRRKKRLKGTLALTAEEGKKEVELSEKESGKWIDSIFFFLFRQEEEDPAGKRGVGMGESQVFMIHHQLFHKQGKRQLHCYAETATRTWKNSCLLLFWRLPLPAFLLLLSHAKCFPKHPQKKATCSQEKPANLNSVAAAVSDFEMKRKEIKIFSLTSSPLKILLPVSLVKQEVFFSFFFFCRYICSSSPFMMEWYGHFLMPRKISSSFLFFLIFFPGWGGQSFPYSHVHLLSRLKNWSPLSEKAPLFLSKLQ